MSANNYFENPFKILRVNIQKTSLITTTLSHLHCYDYN